MFMKKAGITYLLRQVESFAKISKMPTVGIDSLSRNSSRTRPEKKPEGYQLNHIALRISLNHIALQTIVRSAEIL